MPPAPFPNFKYPSTHLIFPVFCDAMMTVAQRCFLGEPPVQAFALALSQIQLRPLPASMIPKPVPQRAPLAVVAQLKAKKMYQATMEAAAAREREEKERDPFSSSGEVSSPTHKD